MSEVGVVGVIIDGETEATGPGGLGVDAVAVLLWDPGSTAASESCILGLVFPLGTLASTKVLWNSKTLVLE